VIREDTSGAEKEDKYFHLQSYLLKQNWSEMEFYTLSSSCFNRKASMSGRLSSYLDQNGFGSILKLRRFLESVL